VQQWREELKISARTKLNEVRADGAPSMSGKKTGLMGGIRREMENKFQNSTRNSTTASSTNSLWKSSEV
jgi:hypothetical protein